MGDINDFEVEYYELAKSPIIHDSNIPDKKPAEKVTFNELVERKDHNPINIRERVNWMEKRFQDLERAIGLVSNNFNDHVRKINEKFDKLDERIGKLENHERIPEEVKNELSSLKSLVETTMKVNDEIKSKTPVFIRELEGKVNHLSDDLKKIKEESDKDYWNRPVILE